MSDSNSASTNETVLRRRPWTVPQLVAHDSMMVLTQHFFGAPASAMMLRMQISCVIGPSGPVCT